MSIKSGLRNAANQLLRSAGLELVRVQKTPPAPSRWTMMAALHRAAALGLKPASLIDVGAAVGDWSRQARSVFPDAELLMIEPLIERREPLDRWASESTGIRIETGVAGASEGEINFTVTKDLDGSGVYGSDSAGDQRRVPQHTIDFLVQRHQLPGPYLLKLDTHGYEVPILDGAAATLANTDVLVVEAYGFRPSPTAIPYWELCSWLLMRGFRPADIVDPMGRKGDGLFWQADFVFLRADHSAFTRNTYA